MTAKFGSQAAETDALMQFLDREYKNMTIQNPDSEEIMLRNDLSDLRSTQSRKIPGLEDRHPWIYPGANRSGTAHMLYLLIFSSANRQTVQVT